MIAIPAIDLIDGKVVRLFQGDYTQQTEYETDALAYAEEIRNAGLNYLHLVDLSGAKVGRIIHANLMEKMVIQTSLKIDFGGGVTSENDLVELFEKGVSQVVIGSLSAKEPELVASWMKKYGSEKFVLALDTDGEFIKIKGWQESSGKSFDEVMNSFHYFDDLYILTTDIRRDGTGTGPSVELYKTLLKKYPKMKLIASGGVEKLSDLLELRSIGCYACVVGKALLDGKISLNELKLFNDVCL